MTLREARQRIDAWQRECTGAVLKMRAQVSATIVKTEWSFGDLYQQTPLQRERNSELLILRPKAQLIPIPIPLPKLLESAPKRRAGSFQYGFDERERLRYAIEYMPIVREYKQQARERFVLYRKGICLEVVYNAHPVKNILTAALKCLDSRQRVVEFYCIGEMFEVEKYRYVGDHGSQIDWSLYSRRGLRRCAAKRWKVDANAQLKLVSVVY